MATTSDRPSTITPELPSQLPHITPSDEDSISSQPPLPHSIDIECLAQTLTKVPPIETSDATLHKNSIEPLSIRILNLVHIDVTNLPPIPPSSTPAPCNNQTQFEYLNLHCIFGCRQSRNQKHLTAATIAILENLGLLPSIIGSFATISKNPKGKTIKKWHQYLEKVHIDIVFGDCFALRGAFIRPTFSWRWYKIMLAIRAVLTIIHVYHFSTTTTQIRRGTPNSQTSLRLQQEINWWKWPPMDPIKRFQHNCRSCRIPIFKWISRTHMAYFNPNGKIIHHR